MRTKRRGFTLAEVMFAVGIVSIAVGSCFQIFYTVRRLNARARFYAKVLPYVREEFTRIVTSHRLQTSDTLSNTPFDGVICTRTAEVDTEFQRCQRVTLVFDYRDSAGNKHKLTFATYVSLDILNKTIEESRKGGGS